MNIDNPSQRNFHSPFRKIKTGLVYVKAVLQKVKNKKVYLDCYQNNRAGIIEFNNGVKIEVEGKRSLQFMNSIFFNKMYGTPQGQQTIIDIGANKGLFAVFFASQLKKRDFKMYCFEPHPNTFQILQNNIRLNQLESNVFTFQKAVSAKSVATQSFFVARDSFDYSVFNEYASDEEITVENTTLKEIMDHNGIEVIDLLKLNCEGSEYEILMKLPKDYLMRIKEIRMEYHNFELDGKSFDLAPLQSYLLSNNFTVGNHLPYRDAHGIIWFKSQKNNIG